MVFFYTCYNEKDCDDNHSTKNPLYPFFGLASSRPFISNRERSLLDNPLAPCAPFCTDYIIGMEPPRSDGTRNYHPQFLQHNKDGGEQEKTWPSNQMILSYCFPASNTILSVRKMPSRINSLPVLKIMIPCSNMKLFCKWRSFHYTFLLLYVLVSWFC